MGNNIYMNFEALYITIEALKKQFDILKDSILQLNEIKANPELTNSIVSQFESYQETFSEIKRSFREHHGLL